MAVQTKKPDFSKLPKYENLLQKVKRGIKDIDFFDLRMSYTQSKDFKFSNAGLDSIRNRMIKALNTKEYQKAIKSADSVLQKEYVDMYSHYVCYYAYSALGDSAKASYHEYLMDRLLNSVIESGDGKSKESAFLIISSNEEYFLIYIYNLQASEKSFTNFDGDPIDVFKAIDPETKESFELYFNTSLLINVGNK
ncbi:MAG: DUF4919 domain-containing protein [Bacteroidetes bacterium]|nr:DUF4919 domain-containing protein [Bacteroidota bacterium]